MKYLPLALEVIKKIINMLPFVDTLVSGVMKIIDKIRGKKNE